MKITKKDFEEYVSGWLFTTEDFKRDALDMENIHSALANSLAMFQDEQDGIEAYVGRKSYDEIESLKSQVYVLNNSLRDLMEENHKLVNK